MEIMEIPRKHSGPILVLVVSLIVLTFAGVGLLFAYQQQCKLWGEMQPG